jgi:hypothetical protein
VDANKLELKTQALASLRGLERELDRSMENDHDVQRRKDQLVSPIWHEQYNHALRQLQQAGEDIKDVEIRPAVTSRYRAGKHAAVEDWISAPTLRGNIKRVLARVDPQRD